MYVLEMLSTLVCTSNIQLLWFYYYLWGFVFLCLFLDSCTNCFTTIFCIHATILNVYFSLFFAIQFTWILFWHLSYECFPRLVSSIRHMIAFNVYSLAIAIRLLWMFLPLLFNNKCLARFVSSICHTIAMNFL